MRCKKAELLNREYARLADPLGRTFHRNQADGIDLHWLCLIAVPAFACICVSPPGPAKWYAIHHGQPTFVGLVVSVETVPDVLRQGGGKPLLDAEGNPTTVTVQKVVFRTEEVFEGIKTENVEVYGSGTTCDYTSALVVSIWCTAGLVRTARYVPENVLALAR